jgi:hypothetical protein
MSDAYRQSALLLHSIGEVDRQWILTQLAQEQRVQLSDHLTELSQMGMPVDRSLVEGLLSSSGRRSTEQIKNHGHALRIAHADVVLHLLHQEPTWLVATLLSIEAWPWRETICMGLDASKRERVKHALRDAVPTKLGHALIAQLEARLPQAVLECQAPLPEPTGLARLGQHIRRMGRAWT